MTNQPLQQQQQYFTVGDLVNYVVAEARKNLANPVKLGVKRLENYPKDWLLPRYATEGSACFDIKAVLNNWAEEAIHINPRESFEIPTGLAFDIPKGYVLMIYSRSGMGFTCGIRLSNCTGVIDSDYVDQVKLKLHNDNFRRVHIVSHGDRIAQAMLVKLPEVELVEVSELVETTRLGGFGSTGA